MEVAASRLARTTDRVALAIPIRIFGSDLDGRAFNEEARTLELSRHGAMIFVNRNLTPLEEIVVHRDRAGKEAAAQVVGQVRKEPDGFVYGVRFLDPNINLWDINFVPLSESDRAVCRTLLECAKCRLREVVYLEEFEVEVFHANQYIYHACKRCRESTIWKETAYEPTEREPDRPQAPPPPPPPPPTAPPRSKNERQHNRINCNLRACIRYKQYEDEVLEVDDVSRGGFGFRTQKYLPEGTKIEAAIPYSPGMANIFVPAQIVRKRHIETEYIYEYGVAYLKHIRVRQS